MKEIGATIRSALGEAADRVPTRSIPNFALRAAARLNPHLRPLVPDLGHAKRTSNEKARSTFDWTPRDPRETIVAAAKSMVERGLSEPGRSGVGPAG